MEHNTAFVFPGQGSQKRGLGQGLFDLREYSSVESEVDAIVGYSMRKLCLEDPENRTATAVARTAPLAGIVYDLVLLWYAARLQQGHATTWTVRPWYRSKSTPSFLDMLTAVRQDSWLRRFSDPPSPAPLAQNSPPLGEHAPQVAA